MTQRTKIRLVCKNPVWVEQYQQMRQDGVSEEEMDGGSFLLRNNPNAGSAATSLERYAVSNGDGRVECAEVAEATAERYEKYQSFLKGLSGRDVPILLPESDDPVLKASLKKIDGAISTLKAELERQGLKPGSEDHDTILFEGLYSFANAPDKGTLATLKERDPNFFQLLFTGLWGRGLWVFSQFLLREGGLGLGFTKDDFPLEGTVAETLQKPFGHCTERSKVFYVVLRRAGLTPVFAHLTTHDVLSTWKTAFGGELPFQLPPQEIWSGHVVVALPLPSKKMYADFIWDGQPWVGSEYQKFARDLSIREFLQIDLNNLASDVENTEGSPEMNAWIQGGLALGDSSVSHLLELHRARQLFANGDLMETVSSVRRMFGLNPEFLPLPDWGKMLSLDAALLEESLKRWRHFSETNPAGHFYLAKFYEGRGEQEKARGEAEMAVANGFQDVAVHRLLGALAHDREDWKNAEIAYRFVVEQISSDVMAHFRLGVALKEQKKWAEALSLFQKVNALTEPLSENNVRSLYHRIFLYQQLGSKKEAKKQLSLLLTALPLSPGNVFFDGYREALFPVAQANGMMPQVAKVLNDALSGNLSGGTDRVILLHALWHAGERERAKRILKMVTDSVEQTADVLQTMEPGAVDADAVRGKDKTISFMGPEILSTSPDVYRKFFAALEKYYRATGFPKEAEAAAEKGRELVVRR